MTKAASGLSACKGCRCLAARRYARELTRLYEGALRPHGLRATQFSVLAALALKGPTPVTALAGTLGLDRTTLTRIAAVLERRRLVAAGRTSTSDARRRILRLTAPGRRKLEEAFPAWKDAQQLAEHRDVDFGRPVRLAVERASGRMPSPEAAAAPPNGGTRMRFRHMRSGR